MSEDKCLIEIMEEIYMVWDHVSKEKARTMLKKLLLSNNLNTIEEKRLVWHNLATISIQIENEKPLEEKDMNQAKHYSKTLLEMLDNYPNYKNTQINRERYCKALNNYAVSHEGEIDTEKLIELHQFCYDVHKDYSCKDIDKYIEKLIAEFNVNILKKNFKVVLLVVEDILIHNDTTNYNEILKSFMKDIKNVDYSTYKEVLLLIQNNRQQII